MTQTYPAVPELYKALVIAVNSIEKEVPFKEDTYSCKAFYHKTREAMQNLVVAGQQFDLNKHVLIKVELRSDGVDARLEPITAFGKYFVRGAEWLYRKGR